MVLSFLVSASIFLSFFLFFSVFSGVLLVLVSPALVSLHVFFSTFSLHFLLLSVCVTPAPVSGVCVVFTLQGGAGETGDRHSESDSESGCFTVGWDGEFVLLNGRGNAPYAAKPMGGGGWIDHLSTSASNFLSTAGELPSAFPS